MGIRPPRMLRQRERGRSDRAFVIINGKRHKLGVWGSEKAEQRYRELIAGFTPKLPQRPAAPEVLPSRPSVQELMVPFMKNVVRRYEKNEAEQWHYRAAMRILKEEFAELPADEFGPRRMRHIQDVMVAKGWSRKYVNGQIGRVRRLFRWAAADERLEASVYHALQTVEPLTMGRTEAAEPEEVEPVDDSTVDATIPHMSATVVDMVRVQRFCGCRPKELCAMTSEQIDRSDDVWLYRPVSHKTQHRGKSRVIAIGPRAQAILVKYLFNDGPLFTNSKGGAYCTETYRQAIRRACVKAWPPKKEWSKERKREWNKAHRWKPNQLRHTTATKVRAEHGVEGAQHILGHSRADVTQVYAERNIAQAIEIAKELG